MYHIFIHSSVDGHLGCFHLLAMVKSAAVNTGVYGYFQIMIFSGYMPRNSGQSQIWDLILLQFSSVFRDILVASVLNHSSYSYFYSKYMMCLFSNLIYTFVLSSSEMYALSHLLKVPSYFCVKLTVLSSVGFCLERPLEFSYQQSFLQHFLF